MNKIVKKLFAALALAAALALVSCDNGSDNAALFLAQTEQPAIGQGSAQADGAYVTLSLSGATGGASGISKSALPDPTQAVFGRFELTGSAPQTSGAKAVSWSCGDGSADASGQLSSAKVSVTKDANYTFTLTATTLGGAVYKDTVQHVIQAQGNVLSFTLRLVKVDSGSSSGAGTASVTVKLPSGDGGGSVNRVLATVYPLDANGDFDPATTAPASGLDHKELEIQDGAAALQTGDLAPGAYCAVFELYGGQDGKALLGTWREYIGIAGGQSSSSTLNASGGADGDQVDLPYSITYHLEDDEQDPATVTAPASYSRHSVLTLEALKAFTSRPNYRIHSWYTDSGLASEFASTNGMTSDLDLYATWDKNYAINIPTFEHGSATATPAGAKTGEPAIAGESVTITPTPNDGWATGAITVKGYDKDGTEVWTTTIPRATTPKTFTMPDLPYGGTVGINVVFLQQFTVSFNENKPANAKADSTAKSTGSMAAQVFVDGVVQNLTQNAFKIVGWTFAGWNTKADGTGTNYADKASFTTNAAATLYGKWTANSNTKYTVKHWQQPANGSTDTSKYTLKETESNKTGTTWAKTAAAKKTYTGFKDPSITQANIKADGSTVVNLYYDRQSYTISKGSMSGGSVSVASSAIYGSTVTITISPSAGFSLDTISVTDASVSGTGNTRTFTMPAKAVTVNATFAVDLATITSDFTIPNGAVVKGELGTNVKICVASGASITLKGMNIGMNADGSAKWGSGDYGGLTCLGDATINLAAGTVNKIMSVGGGNAGIHIKTGTLVIQGSGTLYAHSHDGGAGIGCGYDPNRTGGNIWIKGGTIDARGGVLGAGIGSGGRSTIGWIQITGGTVTAQGGGGAAGIGCGESNSSGSSCPYVSTCGDITISGATVTATKGDGADHSIGKGKRGYEAVCGNLKINGTPSEYISDSPYTVTP